jgi:hypothetical protein
MKQKPYPQLLWEEWFEETPSQFLNIVDTAVEAGDFVDRKAAFHDYVVKEHKGSVSLAGRLQAYAESQAEATR